MKKLIAFALALSCVVSLVGCNTADTSQNTPANAIAKADVLMEATQIYVETELKLTDASCILGNQLSAYRLSAGQLITIDYEMYPVLVENRVVAFTNCFLSDTGDYLTTCGVDFADSFWREYSKHPGTAIAIVYARDGAYLVREGELPVLLHKMPIADCDPITELDNFFSSLVYSVI